MSNFKAADKPTPGPWYWDFNEETLKSESGETILTMGDCYPDGGEPNQANASLITAAPDLLDALELLDLSSYDPCSAAGDWGGIGITLKDINTIKAAIARARGLSQ